MFNNNADFLKQLRVLPLRTAAGKIGEPLQFRHFLQHEQDEEVQDWMALPVEVHLAE